MVQVLGPVLFTIYVNDLLNLEINDNILNYTLYNINLAFADTVLFFEGDWCGKKANSGLLLVNND